jgi:hypothetical protein
MSHLLDIKDWLATVSGTLSGTSPSVVSAYVGQSDRVAHAPFEVQVKYRSTTPVRRANKLDRHEFDVLVKVIGRDVSDDDVLSGVLDDALIELESALDGATVAANAAMSSVHVERVRAFRTGPMSVKARLDRRAVLRVEVDELKGGV